MGRLGRHEALRDEEQQAAPVFSQLLLYSTPRGTRADFKHARLKMPWPSLVTLCRERRRGLLERRVPLWTAAYGVGRSGSRVRMIAKK